jgi:hypothetical protein
VTVTGGATAVVTIPGGGGGSSLLVENVQAGTTYNAVLTDADKLITATNALPVFTMPLNATVNFPVGQQLSTRYKGTGFLIWNVPAGATINGINAGSFRLNNNQEALWFQQATNVWEVEVPPTRYDIAGTKTLGYTDGVLTSVAGPGGATKALSYTDGALTGVVSVASGVTVSKALVYSSGALASVTTVVS